MPKGKRPLRKDTGPTTLPNDNQPFQSPPDIPGLAAPSPSVPSFEPAALPASEYEF
jgi:hypothetical protein